MDRLSAAREQVKNWNAPELREAGLIPKDGSYYPSIYYPPVPMYGPSDENKILSDLKYDPSRPSSVYFHIPFCRSRCRYCHWVVHVGSAQAAIDSYLQQMEQEVVLWKQKFGATKLAPHSILIGGGTPTAISVQQTRTLFELIHRQIDLSACAQITCETEPGSILGESGKEKLRIMREHGVERISLGVQAFDDASLKAMGRAHSSADVREAITHVRNAGFKSLSLDLIYGYPGCTIESWAATLQTALDLGVDAFQLYRLRIVPHGDRVGEVKTRFERTPEIFPSVDDIYVMKQLGFLIAREGGLGEQSRRLFARGANHASQYLKDHCDRLVDVMGFGISSWSNVQGRFFLNTGESLAKYAEAINAGRLPINRGTVRSADDERRWAVILALKHNGVSKAKFKQLTGASIVETFPRQLRLLQKYGLIQETENTIRLTERGVFFADEVVIQFYNPRYLPFPKAAYTDGELNPHLQELS